MYETILMTLDATVTDRPIIEHIKQLAALCGSKVILLHVADGWAAQKFGKEAVSKEIPADQAYLETVKTEFLNAGIPAETELLFGEPRKEILKWIDIHPCNLIAMGTHGHRLLGDLVLGNTASHIQHRTEIPVLLLRAR